MKCVMEVQPPSPQLWAAVRQFYCKGSSEGDLASSYRSYKISPNSKGTTQNGIQVHPCESNDSSTLAGIPRHPKSTHSRCLKKTRKLAPVCIAQCVTTGFKTPTICRGGPQENTEEQIFFTALTDFEMMPTFIAFKQLPRATKISRSVLTCKIAA